MRHQPIATDALLALLWEGEKPIPFDFDEPLRHALEEAVVELYVKLHPECKDPNKYTLVHDYQPPELGKLLYQIVSGTRTINPWEYFMAARGNWCEPRVPLIPMHVPSFQQLKAEMREHFGDSYEVLVQHFVPHFQRLAQDYIPIK